MDFFDRIGETITQVGNAAGQKAKDVSEYAKLSSELHSLEKKQLDYIWSWVRNTSKSIPIARKKK